MFIITSSLVIATDTLAGVRINHSLLESCITQKNRYWGQYVRVC